MGDGEEVDKVDRVDKVDKGSNLLQVLIANCKLLIYLRYFGK
jgi:hypothetical protein